MTEAINELDFLVTWRKISDGAGGEEEIPEPRVGLDTNFDHANGIMEEYKLRIHSYIDGIKKRIKKRFPKDDKNVVKLLDMIRYVHSKLRYEIEIPIELVNGVNKLEDLVMTSHRPGF